MLRTNFSGNRTSLPHRRLGQLFSNFVLVAGLGCAGFTAAAAMAADIEVIQESQLNILSALQTDPVNILSVTQKGRLNALRVRQSGEQNAISALQIGTENIANIEQRGSSLSRNRLALQQISQSTIIGKSTGTTISRMVIGDPNLLTYATLYQTGGLNLLALTPFAPTIGIMGRAH